MRDFNRPALLAALLLLFVFLTTMGPGFMFGISLSGAARWILVGLLVYLAFNCCGGGRCGCRCCGRCTCGENEND